MILIVDRLKAQNENVLSLKKAPLVSYPAAVTKCAVILYPGDGAFCLALLHMEQVQ